MCSPIDIPVRGSPFSGIDGASWVGRKADSALSLSIGVLARLTARSTLRRSSLTAMGASLVVSAPPAMPESIWPSAILFATRIAASRPVPQACWTS